jgi:hypothetical protein
MTTYIGFDTKEQIARYEQECKRLGYPVTGGWPRGGYDSIWDPAVPEGMPRDLANAAYDFAIKGYRPSDMPDQHPQFKFLRVPSKQ